MTGIIKPTYGSETSAMIRHDVSCQHEGVGIWTMRKSGTCGLSADKLQNVQAGMESTLDHSISGRAANNKFTSNY
eukprot:scaffold459839_cov22-Prasinocladus_malaysianus.AAC.1